MCVCCGLFVSLFIIESKQAEVLTFFDEKIQGQILRKSVFQLSKVQGALLQQVKQSHHCLDNVLHDDCSRNTSSNKAHETREDDSLVFRFAHQLKPHQVLRDGSHDQRQVEDESYQEPEQHEQRVFLRYD